MVSGPAFEFKRYYAEASETSGSEQVWLVMGEDKPGNGQYLGYSYKKESNARVKAHILNIDHETGYDATLDIFKDPEKQKRYAEYLLQRKLEREYRENATTMKIVKQRKQENETASSMKDYPGWGSFGNGSAEKISDETITINIDNAGTIKGFGLEDAGTPDEQTDVNFDYEAYLQNL